MATILLPKVKAPQSTDNEFEFPGRFPFSVNLLAWALQQNFSLTKIRLYLEAYSSEIIEGNLSLLVDQYPPTFYAVERNEAAAVRLLIEHGQNPNTRSISEDMPVLAFAIIHARNEVVNTTEVVKTLLGLGADPTVIPEDMWENPLEAPRSKAVTRSKHPTPSAKSSWCTKEYRAAIASTLNLTQRYFLLKAHLSKVPTVRQKQVAKAWNVTSLLEMAYHLVGQPRATSSVMSSILTHLSLNRSRPLVLVFCGPSGHGKTELANQMASLLSCPYKAVDCTEMKHETDIFGPKFPYSGASEGSVVNNFLGENNTRRSVVFLDEFEKTKEEVWDALLLPFDTGLYKDRRNGQNLDCSRTIWLLATNVVDAEINSFFTRHLQDRSSHDQAEAPFSVLETTIKARLSQIFKAPLVGRMSRIVPFFPFQAVEQAVIVHKFLLDFADHIRKPIDLSAKNLIGHIHCDLQRDGEICKHIAEIGYERTFGARSLKRVVDEASVEVQLVENYLRADDEITEAINQGPLQKYTVRLDKSSMSGKSCRIGVARNGETALKTRGLSPPQWLGPRTALGQAVKEHDHRSENDESGHHDSNKPSR